MKKQSRETLEQRRPELIQGLENFGDFYLELKWDFHSWRMCTLHYLGFQTTFLCEAVICAARTRLKDVKMHVMSCQYAADCLTMVGCSDKTLASTFCLRC